MEDLSRISEFAATRHDGERWSSKELEGTWALLWWYPKASTPGCAAEGRAFADHAPEFDEQGCTVFGLSLDTPQDNRSFRDEHDMPFALLSVDNLVATAFGVLRAVDSVHAERRSFLVLGVSAGRARDGGGHRAPAPAAPGGAAPGAAGGHRS